MDAFQQAVQSGVDFANNLLWSYVLIAALIGGGIYFTIRTKFIQFRYLKEVFRVTLDKNEKKRTMKDKASPLYSPSSSVPLHESELVTSPVLRLPLRSADPVPPSGCGWLHYSEAQLL